MADPVEDEVLEAPETGAETASEAAPEAKTAEEEAKLQGWKPKDEFDGPDGKWVDAATFLERGKNWAPRLSVELDKAHKQIEKLEETVKRLDAYSSKAEQRAYERAKAEFEAQLESAAEAGDVEGVKAAAKGIADLEKEAKPAKDGPNADFKEAFADWEKDNSWFNTDDLMQGAAIAAYGKFEQQGLSPKECLARTTERIKAEFPHKFENPRRRDAAAVEGGATARKAGGKGFSDLPPEAKSECDFFVKNVKGFTRERYVKDYFGAST